MNNNIFWTFQRKDLVSKLSESGELIPDFSSLIGTDSAFRLPAYNHILKDYNTKNNSNHKGLIFGIVGSEDYGELNTMNDLYHLLEDVGYPGGTYYPPDSHMLLKIIVPSDINILKIDFYRFSDLIFTYDQNEEKERQEHVISNLYKPNGADSMFDTPGSNGKWELLQGHIPYIKLDWIESVFTPYDK
jgi:hypothetical protein